MFIILKLQQSQYSRCILCMRYDLVIAKNLSGHNESLPSLQRRTFPPLVQYPFCQQENWCRAAFPVCLYWQHCIRGCVWEASRSRLSLLLWTYVGFNGLPTFYFPNHMNKSKHLSATLLQTSFVSKTVKKRKLHIKYVSLSAYIYNLPACFH